MNGVTLTHDPALTWTLTEAVAACILVEAIAPKYNAHVALTGGTLYNIGQRKDVDILFYRVRQADEIDELGLLKALNKLGLEIGQRYGWVQKAMWHGKCVDLFFPESLHNDDNAPLEYRQPREPWSTARGLYESFRERVVHFVHRWCARCRDYQSGTGA